MATYGKRTDAAILLDIQAIECRLSPENLSMDGECPLARQLTLYRDLTAKKKALIAELGRTPTTAEIWSAA